MKKAYENPVAEKIVFDYTTTVVASGATETATTMDHKCVVIVKPEEKPTEGIVVKCVN